MVVLPASVRHVDQSRDIECNLHFILNLKNGLGVVKFSDCSKGGTTFLHT